ncbi:MAG: c-type cytochrome [Myxococcota bacterium]
MSLGLAGSAPASAEPPSSQQLYGRHCESCHGPRGAGSEALKAPALAGLDASYLSRQLHDFASGRRSIEGIPLARAMVALLETLPAGDIDRIAAHAAQLPPVHLEQTLPSTGFRGRGLYSGCSSCHGSQGSGTPELGAPRIAGQHAWYLRAQLRRFRSGQRGADPKDTRGQQMRTMALAIASDEDLEVLVNYVAGMKP